MKIRRIRYVLALSCCLWAFAGSVAAKEKDPASDSAGQVKAFSMRGVGRGTALRGHLVAKTALLNYYGGPTITLAKAVLIFWGPSFSNPSSPDSTYAQTLVAFRDQLGTTPEYKVVKEYSGIEKTDLGTGTADWFDPSTPPTNVTDADVQAEVNLYLASHTFDPSTIYEVFLPSTSYSSYPTSATSSVTSCGGPTPKYCAYHSWIGSDASAIKYSVQAYPSCGGCQYEGWSAVQNQEHFVTHETREAVTDPTGTGWHDDFGGEADDECAWSPPPFFGTGGYGYQFEWSNANGDCISTRKAGLPPDTPTLTLDSYLCAAEADASWSVPSGATAFELWEASSSSFSDAFLLYSGASSGFYLDPPRTMYFEVRACSANGCSAFSNAVEDYYFGGECR